MAKQSWFDDKTGTEQIQDRVRNLESFTNALADGVVTSQELGGQEKRVVDAMKAAEAALNDDQHGKVTTLLVELTAYNIMRLLHELQAERAKMVVR